MKLELKHLAPYLPYGLMVAVNTKQDSMMKPNIGLLCELTYKSNHGNWAKVVFDDCCKVTYNTWEQRFSNFHTYFIKEDDIKPLLLPLSELKNEITVNGETFVPLIKLAERLGYMQPHKWKIKNHSDSTGNYLILQLDEGYVCNVIILDMINFDNNPLWLVNKLYEWHFDVFGLIDAGLAINKLTL